MPGDVVCFHSAKLCGQNRGRWPHRTRWWLAATDARPRRKQQLRNENIDPSFSTFCRLQWVSHDDDDDDNDDWQRAYDVFLTFFSRNVLVIPGLLSQPLSTLLYTKGVDVHCCRCDQDERTKRVGKSVYLFHSNLKCAWV